MVAAQFWEGARVAPQVVVERNGHSVVMRRTVSGALPELVRVRVCAAVWPEATWPKLRRRPGRMFPVIVSDPAPMPQPST